MSKLFYDNKNPNTEPIFKFWSFSRVNYAIFGMGLLFIIIGYIVMAQGPEKVDSFSSMYVAPIILFLGYIILIPFSLVYKPRTKK